MDEIDEKVNELKIEVVEPKIDLDEVKQLSEELKNCDPAALDEFIHENKDELSKLKEEFINEYSNVSNNDPIKKQLIEDLRILSIEI